MLLTWKSTVDALMTSRSAMAPLLSLLEQEAKHLPFAGAQVLARRVRAGPPPAPGSAGSPWWRGSPPPRATSGDDARHQNVAHGLVQMKHLAAHVLRTTSEGWELLGIDFRHGVWFFRRPSGLRP